MNLDKGILLFGDVLNVDGSWMYFFFELNQNKNMSNVESLEQAA